MDQTTLEKLLSDLPLGSVRYYPTIGSTNDLAARWAEAGARDLSLVVADEQTAGRGRMQRRWLTPAGSALAFTLVLRQDKEALAGRVAQVTALGALAVCDTINAALPAVTPAQVKWPNDVVASRRKLAGVLAEAHWKGDELMALILGIGINVAPASVPPAEALDFPATCVETELGASVDRWELLHAVLKNLLDGASTWMPRGSSRHGSGGWLSAASGCDCWLRDRSRWRGRSRASTQMGGCGCGCARERCRAFNSVRFACARPRKHYNDRAGFSGYLSSRGKNHTEEVENV